MGLRRKSVRIFFCCASLPWNFIYSVTSDSVSSELTIAYSCVIFKGFPKNRSCFSAEIKCNVENISGVHTFSSKIRCGECGSWYGSKVWHSNSKYRKVIWQCNHKFDGDKHCSTPHLTDDIIQRAFLSAANKLLATKDTVIADGREMMSLLFDTNDLEREQEELQQETQVVSDMVQQCIYENAHVALDQAEYQKRYDALVARFDKAKARHTEVTDLIAERMARKHQIESYLNELRNREPLTEFRETDWLAMVDFITIHSKKDIRVTLKDGTEIKA